jgi:hypothetical protein
MDAETGNEKWIDTSSGQTRSVYNEWWNNHISGIKSTFNRCGVDYAELRTDLDYVKPLIKLFKKR